MSASLLPQLQSLRSEVSLGSSLKKGGQHRRQASIPSSPQVLSALAGGLHARQPSSVPADALDVSFRLYHYNSGSLSRIALTEDNLVKASDTANDGAWETLTDPAAAAAERDASAANLFGLSAAGLTTDPATPKGQQKHLSGVYVMQGVPNIAPQKSRFAAREQGDTNTTDYRVFLQEEGRDVSSWHDIPLRNADGTLNFVCEIPKDTSAKMEVATGEGSNPIKQDIKKGKLRFYPYNIDWNYGMLPQTWEDPAHTDEALGGVAGRGESINVAEIGATQLQTGSAYMGMIYCGAQGDNDPVDVVEIGSTQLQTGGVYKVKAIGAYAMIDDGELDWKIVCIRADDPLAPAINDIEDVERELPGELERIMVWFRDYKIPDGKPPNAFGYDSKPMNSEFAEMVIAGTHNLYQGLKDGSRMNDKNLALA